MSENIESDHSMDEVKELWESLSPEARRLVGRVIEIEKSKLHMSLPRGVNDEIVQVIKEIVR